MFLQDLPAICVLFYRVDLLMLLIDADSHLICGVDIFKSCFFYLLRPSNKQAKSAQFFQQAWSVESSLFNCTDLSNLKVTLVSDLVLVFYTDSDLLPRIGSTGFSYGVGVFTVMVLQAEVKFLQESTRGYGVYVGLYTFVILAIVAYSTRGLGFFYFWPIFYLFSSIFFKILDFILSLNFLSLVDLLDFLLFDLFFKICSYMSRFDTNESFLAEIRFQVSIIYFGLDNFSMLDFYFFKTFFLSTQQCFGVLWFHS